MKRIAVLSVLILLSSHLIAQPENTKDKSFAKVSLKYTSDYVFMGRTDSLAVPYLSPSFIYFHKSGLFAKGSFSYLTTAEQNRIDLSVISAGYDAVGDRIYGGGSLSAYFFNKDSYAVPSAMVGFLNGYLGYDFMLFELSADASLGLSEDLDVFTGLEVLRTFYLLKNRLLITPSIYANAGSQNYYNEYYGSRNSKISMGSGYGKGNGKGNQGNSRAITTNTTNIQVEQVVVEEASKFQMLDYELSASITFKAGVWRIDFMPKYVIPVNPSTVRVDQAIVFEESLDNVFFWSSSVSFIIK